MSISYVVTVYNKAAYLEATLASIEAERAHTGGEIVLVDDGSTDGSGNILKRFAEANPQARLVVQANKGVVGATNTGFSQARCDLIRFCDADDLLAVGSSAALLRALNSTGADVAFGRHETYLTKPATIPVVAGDCPATLLQHPLRSALRRNLSIPSSTLLTRRAAEQILPLPEHYRTSQDYMMGLRACFCARIAQLDAPLCLGPEHYEARLSADPGRMYGETARFIAEEILEHPDRWRRQDAGYALRRNAGRALLWARRSRQPARRLLKLQFLKHTARFRDSEAAAQALCWIAQEVYGLR